MLEAFANWMNGWTGFDFSGHGWVAVLAGSLGTIALNAGLMWLIIFSHRRGHDDAADRDGRRGE